MSRGSKIQSITNRLDGRISRARLCGEFYRCKLASQFTKVHPNFPTKSQLSSWTPYDLAVKQRGDHRQNEVFPTASCTRPKSPRLPRNSWCWQERWRSSPSTCCSRTADISNHSSPAASPPHSETDPFCFGKSGKKESQCLPSTLAVPAVPAVPSNGWWSNTQNCLETGVLQDLHLCLARSLWCSLINVDISRWCYTFSNLLAEILWLILGERARKTIVSSCLNNLPIYTLICIHTFASWP